MAQAMHAAIDFGFEYPDVMEAWHTNSNYIVVLSVPDETALQAFVLNAGNHDVDHTTFREPDLDGSLTAVALRPSEASQTLCSSLPLALRTSQEERQL